MTDPKAIFKGTADAPRLVIEPGDLEELALRLPGEPAQNEMLGVLLMGMIQAKKESDDG